MIGKLFEKTTTETKHADEHEGSRNQHQDYPVENWQYEVANGDTRLGYWDWVINKIEN